MNNLLTEIKEDSAQSTQSTILLIS